MAIANYVIRLGEFYAWRGKAIQVPLSTTDPTRARRFASAATAAASVGGALLDAGRIAIHDIEKGVQAAVQRETLALDCEAAGGDDFFSFISKEEPDEEGRRQGPRSGE